MSQGDMYFWSGARTKELTKGPKVARKAADAEKLELSLHRWDSARQKVPAASNASCSAPGIQSAHIITFASYYAFLLVAKCGKMKLR